MQCLHVVLDKGTTFFVITLLNGQLMERGRIWLAVLKNTSVAYDRSVANVV